MTARTMSEVPGARRPHHHHYQQPKHPPVQLAAMRRRPHHLPDGFRRHAVCLLDWMRTDSLATPLFPGCHLTAGPRNRPTRLDKETSPFPSTGLGWPPQLLASPVLLQPEDSQWAETGNHKTGRFIFFNKNLSFLQSLERPYPERPHRPPPPLLGSCWGVALG